MRKYILFYNIYIKFKHILLQIIKQIFVTFETNILLNEIEISLYLHEIL